MAKIFHFNWQSHTLNLSNFAFYTFFCVAILSFTQSANASDAIAPEASSGIHDEQTKIAYGQQFMAVTANSYATQAAYNILSKGGSAIDAAISAQLVLGLVEPQSSGIGGGAFILHWNKQLQQLQHFDGRETAPAAVNTNHFVNPDGKPLAFFDAVIGGYSVGVPGIIAALELAHKEQGKLPWASLFEEAITLSKEGFIVSKRLNQLSGWLAQGKYNIANDSSNKVLADYLLDQGKPRQIGSRLKNPLYAETLNIIAKGGSQAFYNGEIATAIVKAVKISNSPGKLSLEDLQDYRPIANQGICSPLNAFTLCGSPAPSSGPLSVIQQLLMINHTPELSALSASSPSFYHRLIEASKLSFADRNRYISDPNFSRFAHKNLVDGDYLQQRSQQINLLQASKDLAEPGKLPFKQSYLSADALELPSTSHLSIVDSDGNAVSMTSSIETAFGSRIMVKGFILNNQLSDFSFLPEVNNRLVANRIEPGKRPRSSMSPMIVFKDGKVNLLIGSPGGARIINYMTKTLAQHLLLSTPLEQAINSPHISNLNKTESRIEDSVQGKSIAKQLARLGHDIELKPQTSGIHAIQILSSGMLGIADTRREGAAKGR